MDDGPKSVTAPWPSGAPSLGLQHQGDNHARIALPPLDAEQAVLLVTVLERAIEAIWRAHGDGMADYLGRVAPDSMPRPKDAVWSGDPEADGDLDF